MISRWARGTAAMVAERRPHPGDAARPRRRSTTPSRHRPYSLSALQRFAACPYQFLLAAIHRIEPWEEPEPIVRMDPLTRGSLFHRDQAEFFRELQAARRVAGDGREPRRRASARCTTVVDAWRAEYAERLGAGDRTRLARRDRRDSPRPGHLGRSGWPANVEWIPEVLRVQLRLERRGARSAQRARSD